MDFFLVIGLILTNARSSPSDLSIWTTPSTSADFCSLRRSPCKKGMCVCDHGSHFQTHLFQPQKTDQIRLFRSLPPPLCRRRWCETATRNRKQTAFHGCRPPLTEGAVSSSTCGLWTPNDPRGPAAALDRSLWRGCQLR